MTRLLLFALCLCTASLFAQSRKTPDSTAVTYHQITIGGQPIRYKATAGYMPVKDESDTLKAKLFYIAYTREGVADVRKRPILFAYNGGPGSASIWLHMGALGPKRVVMADSMGNTAAPPYSYVDNQWSWLDETDIVFIDPMLTGFTRPYGKNDKSQFTGYENDVQLVGDFIRLYTTQNQRWASPKFVGGESYGTTRSAGVAQYLQNRYGFYLNGVVLISAILDFGSVYTDRGNDRPFPLQLPTFAATAWYHKKLNPRFNSLPALLAEVEQFSLNEYAPALMKGDALPQAEKERIASKMADYTGLSKAYLLQNHLRLFVGRFNKELLRSEGKTVGRLDSRFTGFDYDEAGDEYDFDPSYDAVIYGVYSTSFNDYIRRDLKYENDLPYEVLTSRPRPWLYATNKYLNTAEALREAMVKNPFLKVWVANGYYDMATPYFATADVVGRMGLPAPLRANISQTFYPAGHMMYVQMSSLQQLKADFAKWVRASY